MHSNACLKISLLSLQSGCPHRPLALQHTVNCVTVVVHIMSDSSCLLTCAVTGVTYSVLGPQHA